MAYKTGFARFRPTVLGLAWIFGMLLLSACDAVKPTAPVPSVATPVAAFTQRKVEVTLNEGTNLSVAVDELTGERVISLQGTLFLLPASGAEPVALTDAYYDAREPQFSPDGQEVVFQGYRNGNWDLWRVGRDGQPPTPLTQDAFDDREPHYAHDATRLVFSSDRSGRYDVWQLEFATGELTQLTQSLRNAYAPALSTSGQLAYVDEGSGVSRLMIESVDGAPSLLLEEIGVISALSFSPDETHLAYHLMGRSGAQLKVADLTNKTAQLISQAGADVFPFKPHWRTNQTLVYSADGQIFYRALSGDERQSWPFAVKLVLTRHDYERRQRNYDPQRERLALGLSSPSISNDGTQVYFAALGDLWRWQPNPKQLERLTDDAFAEFAPVLSPDGTSLAYVSDAGGQINLRVMNVNTRKVRKLAVQAGQISMPSWSPQGDRLAFFVDVPGNPLGGQMRVLDIATQELVDVLTPMPAQPISWSADGGQVAVSRLDPYSSRYREGVFELLVFNMLTEKAHAISPVPHQSLLSGALTADGAMTYVQGGLLHRLELNQQLQPLEHTGAITDELTDSPRWSANGKHLVYLSGNRLKHKLSDGMVVDITPQIPYTLDTPAERYVVHAGRLFTGADDQYAKDQYVWISGNVIEKITPPMDTGDLLMVDASDQTLVPGLFEMHAHLGETSEIQGRIWLSYGITTVRDPGSNPYVAKARQEAWDSGRRVGPRTHVTGYLTDGNRVYYTMAEGISSRAHLHMALQRTEQLQLDFIKTYVRLPDEWQKEVVTFAHNIGIAVSSHELYPAVAHGMDHVEHIGGTSRRGYQPKVSRMGYSYGDVVELISASGMGLTATAVLPGFAVILQEEPAWLDSAQFNHFYGDKARRAYAAMLKQFGVGAASIAQANARLLRALTARDALLVTGTDSPFVPYGAGLHAELRLFARAGIENADILRHATLKSAQAAGVAAELGTIAPGKLADLVIIDGDPLANIGDLDNVVATIKNGRHFTLEQLLNPKR